MILRRYVLLVIACLGLGLICSNSVFASATNAQPYEQAGWTSRGNVIDAQVTTALARQGLRLRNPCSDEVFIRRVFLDVIGALPTPTEVEAFLSDTRPNKRAILIESLLSRDEYADYWSMKWCDILRVKAEYPINLWPNAVQAYHRWVHTAIRDNMPYDQFARQLLTSNGSNFRNPQVNFYRAVQGRTPVALAKAVALTFMGIRIERWPETRQSSMAAFFSRVAYKKTDEWKEEIVYPDPKSVGPMKVVFPDATTANLPAYSDPRLVFTDWLVSSKNPWFARNAVNRIWFWLMGRGIIQEPDDIRPDNPPASPETLTCLANAFVASHYDTKYLLRLILNSNTYQQSSIPAPGEDDSNPKVAFARYSVRQLDAEVLIDALCWIGGSGEGYSSATPEPYTFIPKENRTISLADGSITSPFLTTFGRPSRDTGLLMERDNKPTDTQRLYMLNSSDVQKRIDGSPILRPYINYAWRDKPAAVKGLYEVVLSRMPTAIEQSMAEEHFKTKGLAPRQAANDLAWALINSKEFLNRH
jgi:hypothetical protein